MKFPKLAIASIGLGLWTYVSVAIMSALYAVIGSQFEGRKFWDLERSFGGFTIPITKTVSADISWFQIGISLPMLIILAVPAVFVLDRVGRRSQAEQIDDGNSVKPPGDERTP